MKIYLAFTVLGDRAKLELVESLAKLLQSRGHTILTTHLLSRNVRDEEALKTPQFIFERDMKWIDECDALIAEVSGSGFGVGFETGYLLGKGKKKVYILYDKSNEQTISRMARGNTMKKCKVVAYSSIGDIYKFVEENF